MEQPYTLLDSTQSVGDFQKRLLSVESIGFDLECSGLDFLSDRIRLAQFDLNGKIYLLEFDSTPNAEKIFTYLIQLIQDTQRTIIAHNAKFDLKFTFTATGILLTKVYCTQLAEQIHTAGIAKGKEKYPTLKRVVAEYCGVTLDKEVRLDFVTKEVITEEMLLYSALDVKYLRQVKELQEVLANVRKYKHVLDLEMDLLPIVARMEYDGVLVNMEAWMLLAEEAEEIVRTSKEKLTEVVFGSTWEKAQEGITNAVDAYRYYHIPVPTVRKSSVKRVDLTYLESLTSPEFILEELKTAWNVGSNTQKKRALELCGIRTNDTQRGTLERLADEHEMIQALLDFSRNNKTATTYGRNWQELVHPKTGRVHPQWNQCGTATGRWSSNNPNLQNIPRDIRYRHCFVARPGYKLLTCDYSQAEMRFMGAVSKEKRIIEAYVNGEDIHSKTASGIYSVALEDVTGEQRADGKTVNFSIIYGTTAFGMAKKNDIPEHKAEELLSGFFKAHPNLDFFIRKAGELVVEHLMSRTPFGRIRFFEERTTFKDYKARRKWIASLKREGVNHIIQGGSADSLKIAMVNMYYNNPFGHDNFRFLLQVHDEVVAEVREDLVKEGSEFLVTHMEEAEQQFLGIIPAVADCSEPLDYWTK